MFGMKKKEEPLLSVLATHERGIYKRIDENRELLELLKREAPDFMQKHFWVEGWLESHDRFFTDLEEAAAGRGNVKNLPRAGSNFPRPWPGNRSDRGRAATQKGI